MTFFFIMFLMINIYGSFDIGEKKSKPVVFSLFMNVVITDIIALVILKVMAVHDKGAILIDLVTLLVVIFSQLILIYGLTYLGNHLYFKMFNAIRVSIVHNNSKDYPLLKSFFDRHQKQFDVLSVYNTDDMTTLEFEDVQQIYLLDMPVEQLFNTCTHYFMEDIDVYFNASIQSVIGGSVKRLVIGDVLMYEYPSAKITFFQGCVKRLVDIFVSCIALLVFSPVFIGVGIAIKLDDRGPVFYRQERMTKDGHVFKIIKFRSMKMNSGHKPAMKNDDRITKVGYVIRKFRLDEIPQFLNILKGEMSVVGPRPESKSLHREITEVLPEFEYRLKVKAGLTGYAQIFGKYNTSPKKKLILDMEYIENYSLIEDVKLIFQTMIVFFKTDSTEGFDNE